MEEKDIAYIAGIFDGEGWCGIGTGGRIEARVVNTNQDIIRFLKESFNGCIYERKKPKGKKCWDWVLSGEEDVKIFLGEIRPFIRIKGEQIDRSIRIRNLIKNG